MLSRHGVPPPRLDAAAARGLAVPPPTEGPTPSSAPPRSGVGGLLFDAFDEVSGGEVFSGGIAIVRSRSLADLVVAR